MGSKFYVERRKARLDFESEIEASRLKSMADELAMTVTNVVQVKCC